MIKHCKEFCTTVCPPGVELSAEAQALENNGVIERGKGVVPIVGEITLRCSGMGWDGKGYRLCRGVLTVPVRKRQKPLVI